MSERFLMQGDLDREVPQPSNVIPIGRARARKVEIHEPTVDLLERLLDRAKRGEIVGIAVATAYANGATGTGFTHARTCWETVLAAMYRLRLRLDDYERSTD